ncbi:MAG: class I SAM-dependent methyltransferase [Candidatus Hodarchaeales archaeon]|jgi:ubiquinone/menaquinone biosynthesis C-methylase UbiE
MERYWEKMYKSGYGHKVPEKDVEKLVQLFKKRKVHRILDLGCGMGRHTLYLAKKGFLVIGSDISSTALKKADKWLKNKIKNYSLIEHDMIELPFLDNHFDAVVSTNVIHHNRLKDVKKTVNEIRRVLNKNGLVFVTIASTKDHKYREGKKLEPHTYLRPSGVIHHFFDEKRAKKLFSKFKIINIEEKAYQWKTKGHYHWHILAKVN